MKKTTFRYLLIFLIVAGIFCACGDKFFTQVPAEEAEARMLEVIHKYYPQDSVSIDPEKYRPRTLLEFNAELAELEKHLQNLKRAEAVDLS